MFNYLMARGNYFLSSTFYTSSSLEHLSLNANLSPLEQVYFLKINSKKKDLSNNTHSSFITQYFPGGEGWQFLFMLSRCN